MANNIAFQAMGNAVALVASSANTQSNVATITANTPCQQYLLSNQDTANIDFVQLSSTNSFNTAIPLTGSSQNVIPVLPFDEKEAISKSSIEFKISQEELEEDHFSYQL